MLGVPRPTIPLPPGLELVGRYRLGAPVRGVGNSYLAHDVVEDRPVVVKLLGAMPFDVDLERVERALAPMRALDAACLPRPIELCDARLQERHCVFLVQEYLEGETLEERLLRDGPLPPAELRPLARRLLELLRSFSEADPPLIHGDINPRNLVFTPGAGLVALVDWGPVKAAARDWSGDSYGPEGWTQAVERAFAAPEVPMGSVNLRSDLYGVGACLAYALTGLEPESIRDKDPRGGLARGLEQLHAPRSLAALLVPMLEPTLERRLDSPQAALDLLLDPIAGRRGGTTVRRPGEPVDWHMEPHAKLGALWSAAGVALAALLVVPLVAAAVAVAAPVAFSMAGWAIALRLGIALVLAVVSLLLLRGAVRAFAPMGRLRLQGMGRALRIQQRRGWIELPWLQLGRVRRVGPLLRIDGAWSVPPAILPRRRVLWVAPVYEQGLDRLEARIGAHRARARSMVSGALRHRERRWPGARLPPLELALPAGLVLLGAVIATDRWGSDEPAPDGGQLLTPSLPLEAQVVREAGDEPARAGLEARLALSALAAERPATTPEEARAAAVQAAVDLAIPGEPPHSSSPALEGFQQALAEVRGIELNQQGGAEGDGPPPSPAALAPPPAQQLHFDQALHPLSQPEPVPEQASPGTSPGAAAPVAAPLEGGRSPCPAGFEPRVLAPSHLISPACWDAHGTMVAVPAAGVSPAFFVDWTEVSVADYARCVADDACEVTGRQPGCYGTEAARGHYPVNCVDQAQAQAWCSWAGRRLCTQAEHVRAAQGVGGAVYPWGDAPPACERVIMDARGQRGPAGGTGCGRGGPWPVGSRPAGVSPAGALDLSGNLAEWTVGEPGGVAGGGYMDRAPEELQAGSLRPLPADIPVPDVGFRCCLDVE